MTPDALRLLCLRWQRVLGLSDWDVKVSYVRAYDMEGQGRCSATPKLRKALIAILDPQDYDPAQHWPQDVEQTLVHELLHLYFRAGDIGSVDELNTEQGVEATAKALVLLSRQSKGHL